jgi:alpha-N-arabinofuranosidase
MGQKAENAPPGGIVANVDTQQTSQPVSKYVFGMFIEHIGKTMYGPIWAEMLDDRKFYFPITSAEPETAARRQGGSPMRMPLEKWRPVGGDGVVAMDKERPFVGEHSPRIALDASTPHGIRQSGLALVKGKHYTGRIWLRGTPGSTVKVTLVWGEGAAGRETVILPALTAAWVKYPFHFTASADAGDAALEITGTGAGNFHIGAVSLMPADNIDGFRPDTIALIKQIKSGFWRFGGNYTANYTWYDAIGDPDKRQPDWDFAWNQMQTNDLGPDEFAEFCKLIGVEPYISVNAGLGDAHSAAEEVEYMNGGATTRLGALRAKNGHPEPYRIRFWNIGNEPWGAWEIGRTDLKYFMQKHNEFAREMRKVDPSIVLIASGEMLEDGQVPGELRSKYVGNLGGAYGSDFDWTGGFLKDCWGNFDGMAEHWYAQPGRRYNVEKAKNLPADKPGDDAFDKIDQTTLEYARYSANIVHSKAEEWHGYQQRFPAILQKKTFLSIDEYAYFGGGFGRAPNLKQALAYAMLFNEMLRHTDSMTMAAHTMGTSTIDFNKTSSTLNALGLVFRLYSNHFPGTIPVSIAGNSPQPAPQYPPAPDQPKTSSGSPNYPLDVFAALTPDHKFLTVAVVNATDLEQKLDLNVAGAQLSGTSTLWQMTGKSLDSVARLGQAPEVEVKEIPLGSAPHQLTVAPISINIYRFPVAPTAQ